MRTNVTAMALVSLVGFVHGAQPPVEKPAEKPPAQPAASPPRTPAPQPVLPSLDDALGLTPPGGKPKSPTPTPTTTDPAPTKPQLPSDLDRALKGEEEGNELQRAVSLMNSSARRLEAGGSTGETSGGGTSIETQRMQEETVRLLDALVKKGNKKNKPQSKPQNKPHQDQKDQQQPNQSQQSQSEQQKRPTEPTDRTEVGGNTSVQLRPGIDAARAAWGNLPQRVRQLLMQGSGDQFSKEYQRLTEEYYKRLGEGGSGN